MQKTYTGRCHCGAVRFEADVDISIGTTKCNCSICAKSRLWTVQAGPTSVRILVGETVLTDYRGANPVAHHFFCSDCGVRPFQRVDPPNMSGGVYFNVNLACLADVDIDELMAAPVEYCDGLNNAWERPPAEVRHL
jgi:hypothetical protein